jgi:hypothetical protein
MACPEKFTLLVLPAVGCWRLIGSIGIATINSPFCLSLWAGSGRATVGRQLARQLSEGYLRIAGRDQQVQLEL